MSLSLIEEMAGVLRDAVKQSEALYQDGCKRTHEAQKLYERAKAAVARYEEMKSEEDISSFF